MGNESSNTTENSLLRLPGKTQQIYPRPGVLPSLVSGVFRAIHQSGPYACPRNFFFYHGFADLLRHIRILSILRAHFGLIRCIHRQINARGRLAYRLVITGIYA